MNLKKAEFELSNKMKREFEKMKLQLENSSQNEISKFQQRK